MEIGGLRIHVTHDVKTMGIDPVAEWVDVVIAGHSHQPKIEQINGVLYLNPGSAGRRRFTLPISLALLDIEDGQPPMKAAWPSPAKASALPWPKRCSRSGGIRAWRTAMKLITEARASRMESTSELSMATESLSNQAYILIAIKRPATAIAA